MAYTVYHGPVLFPFDVVLGIQLCQHLTDAFVFVDVLIFFFLSATVFLQVDDIIVVLYVAYDDAVIVNIFNDVYTIIFLIICFFW